MRKLLDTRFYEVLTRPNTRACKQTRALSCIFLFLFLGCHRLCLKVVCMADARWASVADVGQVLLLYLRYTLLASGAVREARDGATLRFPPTKHAEPPPALKRLGLVGGRGMPYPAPAAWEQHAAPQRAVARCQLRADACLGPGLSSGAQSPSATWQSKRAPHV